MPSLSQQMRDDIKSFIEGADGPQTAIEELRDYIFTLSPRADQPVDRVRWVPIDMVQANDYNPNSVPKNEMRLLHVSISHDGYTQPVVTVWDPEIQKYVIVDGFHRYSITRLHEDIREHNGGFLPVVVIDKDINDRMASTVRHNRARGKHSVAGMGNIVFQMLQNGASDQDVCNEVGLEAEELARLKHVTGFAKLFSDVEYSKAWETDGQVKRRAEWIKENPEDVYPPKK